MTILEKAGSGSIEPEDFNRVVDELNAASPAGSVTAADIDSQAAQDGDVLTADGAGGASWKPGGGSQLWQVLQLPIAFDTPNIILPDAPNPPGSAGVTICTPNVGDQLVAYSVSVTTAWNGTTPRLYIGAQGCDPNNVGDQFSGGQNLAAANGSSGSFGYDVAGAGAFSVWPDVANAAVPLQAYIGSNTAPYGDPGSSQGEGLITVIFIPAP